MLSHEPEIGERAKMTPMEKRLARRIHNQRRRLKQLEDFNGWRNGTKDRELKDMYRKLARERLDQINELKAKLAGARSYS